jgi:amino acid adenylation domain-containing protein
MDDRIQPDLAAEQAAPLSFAQQRLWLLDRLIPLGSVYNIEHVLKLEGELDHVALRAALNEIVRRHEVLRTHFGMQDGEAVQVIVPELDLPLDIDDLEPYPEDERGREAQQRAQAQAEAPFDLARGPLLRARLLRFAPSLHWLVLTMHHIVTDGWSSGVLTRELTALYMAYRQHEPSPLPALPVQYADYAIWQHEWLKGATLDSLLAHWRRALADLPDLELPTDRPRPAASSYRGGLVRFTIPEPLLLSLKELGRREGATTFMVLLAAYQILLFRYSRQEDIAVGVPTAGRNRPQLEPMIGFFVNTLVLRGDLSGNPTFRQYVAQVRSRALDAYTHQELPFERLVLELAPKRDLSRNPLFQASLALNNTPPGRWNVPGLEVQRVETVFRGTAKFDLSVYLTENDGALTGSFGYATDLFDAATIEQMTGHFLRLLEGIVANPDDAIGRLPMLTAAQRTRLTQDWNATSLGFPRDRCIHHLFDHEAARHPDAVAVVFGDAKLTYRELDMRATDLARRLASLGVGPDVRVGISMERSLDMVAGLLAILKAGGAYVPLDPRLPAERLQFIAEDAGIAVVITHRSLARPFSEARCTVVDLDGPLPRGMGREALPATTPSHLAYVLYTSGSTGVPKGVAVEHRSVVSFLHWVRATFSDAELGGVLAGTSISFDISIFELFGTLCCGGRIILVESPLDLGACAHREEVTLVNTVPSVMRTLLEAQRLPSSVTTVNLAGEPLPERLVDALYACPHVRRVHDLYGPTETTIYSTFALRKPGERATIGRPIANTRIYLLDALGEPVPVRVTGELCIGGDGLARGYLDRPDLTAERFVSDPFSPQPGARLYRTGDLARYRHDGCIEFLGREDSQVKLRGFRIELGEIEAALARHPGVRDVAVVVREDTPELPEDTPKTQRDTPKMQRLVAYVAAADGEVVVADLRGHVERSLPRYMLPETFVVLPALPQMPNGKVDRKRLPAPDFDGDAGSAAFEPPRTPIETAMANVWAEVLGVPRVGRNDNFFDLGGHSLLAAQLVGKLNRMLGIDITLRQLFESPSVRGLALAALQSLAADAA